MSLRLLAFYYIVRLGVAVSTAIFPRRVNIFEPLQAGSWGSKRKA